MDGREQAAKREMEQGIALAWQIAARSAEAQAGKLKKLAAYLPERKAQTPAEMLAAFMAHQSQGAPMSIRKLN